MPNNDFASEFEQPVAILEDLLAIAIDELGIGGRRAMSVLLAALRYTRDIKTVNQHLMQAENTQAET